MAARSTAARLQDILDNIAIARAIVANGSPADITTRLAVERAVEIISEASRHVPQAKQVEHPHIPWRDIANIGNWLRHAYHRVDSDLIWGIVLHDLDALQTVVERLIIDERQRSRSNAAAPEQDTANKRTRMTPTRIDTRFAKLKREGRPALVTFISAGDPDKKTSLAILKGLPAAGADVIEIGMPFSDPMADGPAIQASSLRALDGGQKMRDTLDMVAEFRKTDPDTPIVLMGYYNPIYVYPRETFLDDAAKAGADGLIVVDLPPEADDELCLPAMKKGLNFIRLATPTTDDKRLPAVLANTSGFVYYVTVTGVTGGAAPVANDVQMQVKRIKAATKLPVVAGFGVKTGEQARAVAKGADGVVVGSALVTAIATSLDAKGAATGKTVPAVLDLVKSISAALR